MQPLTPHYFVATNVLLEKDGKMSEDDSARNAEQVQKATDTTITEIDALLVSKEKEIMQV